MGNAAAVGVQAPPEPANALRQSVEATRQAVEAAHVVMRRAAREAERYYAVVDERVLSRVHCAVEDKVLRRVRLLMDHVEVASKLWFVKTISTTSIADAFEFQPSDVQRVLVEARDYEVYNCGPELLNVPSWKKVARVLELKDAGVTDFLLRKCVWAAWQPPTSWRVKVDQVFNLTVFVRMRRNDFLTDELRVVRLRVGKKWIGAHHNDHGDLPYGLRSKWLHRVDYEVGDDPLAAESVFFQTINAAWKDYLDELMRLPKEDLRASDETGDGFPYDEQEQRTSLRIKYLLETALEAVLNDKRTLFRSPHEYEQWRMEQEDAEQHRETCMDEGRTLAGPLLNASLDELMELYESKAMEAEDTPAPF